MKSFLKQVCLFLIPILAGTVVLEVLLRQVPNEFTLKNDFMEANAEEIEVLILGPSHAFFGIIPDSLQFNAFNMAYPGQSIEIDLEILKKYAPRLTNLKTVIQPMSYFTLFNQLENDRLKNYSIYYSMDLRAHPAANVLFVHDNLRAHTETLKHALAGTHPKMKCDERGWGNTYSSDETYDLDEYAMKNVKWQNQQSDGDIDACISDLGEIVQISEELGANMLLLSTPITEMFWVRSDQTQFEMTSHIADSLAQSSTNITYLDMKFDGRFSESDFYDSDHLNDVGAAKFSSILNQILIESDQ